MLIAIKTSNNVSSYPEYVACAFDWALKVQCRRAELQRYMTSRFLVKRRTKTERHSLCLVVTAAIALNA